MKEKIYNFLKQNWFKLCILIIMICAVSCYFAVILSQTNSLQNQENGMDKICLSCYCDGENFSGKTVTWQGEIKGLMTYGRYRIEKYPKDNRSPYFIVEFFEDKQQEFNVGDFIEVKGQTEQVLQYNQCEPWILVDMIRLIK